MSDDDRITWYLLGARAACRRLGIGWTVELECSLRNQLLAAELGIEPEPIRPRRPRTCLEAFAESVASGCDPERAGDAVMGRGGRS